MHDGLFTFLEKKKELVIDWLSYFLCPLEGYTEIISIKKEKGEFVIGNLFVVSYVLFIIMIQVMSYNMKFCFKAELGIF